MPLSTSRAILLVIFTISGFSGLIYESIWSHYLKLFLGHAAYSQTLVLAIFMGGMAIGSGLASKLSIRWRQVLIAYAAIEAVTGVFALAFHPLFEGVTEASFNYVIPALGSGTAVQAYKWGLGALMILPQSILLGMTFPLMSAGFLRFAPATAGTSIALLYFTNSFGGAIGVLVSGFALIPAVGLPGTMLTAGLLNFGVALMTWMVVKSADVIQPPVATGVASATRTLRTPGFPLLLLAALITGIASFLYEIGWIRMLTQVLGASTHSFELMLSVFIFGLAFGGLWVKRRVDSLADARVYLGYVQLAMGSLALATLFLYGHAFEWMSLTLRTFAKTAEGYVGFHWASHLISAAIMFPAAFCAGMTLPLITRSAFSIGIGERAVGAIYSANTVGAIVGVMAATHLLMPSIGARGVVIAGAAMDIGLGLWFFAATGVRWWNPRFAIAAAAGGLAILGTGIGSSVDEIMVVSGVYRHGDVRLPGSEVRYLHDGKTATIGLIRTNTWITIATNGKADASVNMGDGPPATDEPTQTLTGAIPLALHPEAKTAAIIGFGSGMSSHVMLSHPQLEQLDTIEIEARMVEAARIGFSPRNRLAFEDPRSKIHIEDAKTFFSASGKKYDIIISEPSNPWVSGVASLFSNEFYRNTVRHLKPNGLLVQWMQLYQMDINILASVVNALSPWFADYAIYVTDRTNIVIVARPSAKLPPPSPHIFSSQQMRDELRRVGVLSADDLRIRRIGGKDVLDPLFRATGAPPNSDYFPFVDVNAPKARYLGAHELELAELINSRLPIVEMLSHNREEGPAWGRLATGKGIARATAQAVIRALLESEESSEAADFRREIAILRAAMHSCPTTDSLAWESTWIELGMALTSYLEPRESANFWRQIVPQKCRNSLSSSVSTTWLDLLVAVGSRNPQGMIDAGESLLSHKPKSGSLEQRLFVAEATLLGYLAKGDADKAASFARSLPRYFPAEFKLPLEARWLISLAARASYSAASRR